MGKAKYVNYRTETNYKNLNVWETIMFNLDHLPKNNLVVGGIYFILGMVWNIRLLDFGLFTFDFLVRAISGIAIAGSSAALAAFLGSLMKHVYELRCKEVVERVVDKWFKKKDKNKAA